MLAHLSGYFRFQCLFFFSIRLFYTLNKTIELVDIRGQCRRLDAVTKPSITIHSHQVRASQF